MSLLPFYHKGKIVKSVDAVTAATTVTIWTPTTGTKIVLEDVLISGSPTSSGTIALYFGADSQTLAPQRIALVNLLATTSISIPFRGLASRVDGELLRATPSITGSYTVTAYGFELE